MFASEDKRLRGTNEYKKIPLISPQILITYPNPDRSMNPKFELKMEEFPSTDYSLRQRWIKIEKLKKV